jgi:hypothetical protein
MAYEILNYSRYADVLNKDDMSVIVLKVLWFIYFLITSFYIVNIIIFLP